MTHRVLLVPLLLLAASLPATWLPASSALPVRADALCFGQVPTIVGSPDEPSLSGTEGDRTMGPITLPAQ